MRFDFYASFNGGEIIPWMQVLEMMRAQVRLADTADFTTVWLSEHHFAHNGFMNAPPNPILVGADLAHHCERLRIGLGPVVLPDWHPLRVAEDVAMLDNITGGRVDFGVGRGINERGTLQFNIDADRRDNEKSYALFRESLEVILAAWTDEAFTFDGTFYKFPVAGWKETNTFVPLDPRYHDPDGEYKAMYVHPRTVQQPHPPVWLMSNAPHTFEFAASRGFNVNCMRAPDANLKACWDAYDAAVQQSGTLENVNTGCNGMCLATFVADTMEVAEETIRPAIAKMYGYLSGSKPDGSWARQAYLPPGQELTDADREADWFDFLTAHDIIWVGTPEHVAERIQNARDSVGLKHMIMMQTFPGVSNDKILSSMALMAERVMPQFSNT